MSARTAKAKAKAPDATTTTAAPPDATTAGATATPPPAVASALSRALLAAFALAVAVDLVSLLAGADLGHRIAKPLLMPLLAAYAATRGAPKLLLAALLLGWGGDVLLLSDADGAFLAGMGSFAAGHVCYLILFGRRRASVPLGLAYTAVLLGTVALLWPDLPAELRIPVVGYSLLLTALACRSGSLGLTAGAGGALFLLSDTLIATGIAEWPRPPASAFWVMATYIAAQYLLTAGVLTQAYGDRSTAD
ncbi:lysoplasmalogenase [Streptomyces sp. Je 1-79]|uniref:lysoplasmalogenase n=1 Tax=Streptomyces sp. Je 1-79 TaxID=2943847 RepID=UPI0021A444E9|nr:lysoplasmalogenase [Streptomyces sp. Je 1-79]MCT4354959.1 lysoplasmalogenase [Streptomyces sp. Je 1-79]